MNNLTVEMATDVMLGPCPLDDEDMTEDVVRTAVTRHMGAEHPRVPLMVEDIMRGLRAYELHRLG